MEYNLQPMHDLPSRKCSQDYLPSQIVMFILWYVTLIVSNCNCSIVLWQIAVWNPVCPIFSIVTLSADLGGTVKKQSITRELNKLLQSNLVLYRKLNFISQVLIIRLSSISLLQILQDIQVKKMTGHWMPCWK
jgi:hypothetical protein